MPTGSYKTSVVERFFSRARRSVQRFGFNSGASVLIASAFVLGTLPAQAATFNINSFNDTPRAFTAMVGQDTGVDSNVIRFINDEDIKPRNVHFRAWSLFVEVRETDGGDVLADTLRVRISSQHLIPPHAEDKKPNPFK